MAEYDYRCLKCEREFVVRETIGQHSRTRHACPYCKNKAVERVYSRFYANTASKT